ncbi:MAG TPA: hypothetical protein DEA08_19155 [Planctomycetes bacterium]|nr:hypothetical protein [Planctomycetota bacterium]
MQELARRGLLPRPRLLLAAYLGSSGALALLGDAGFPEEANLLTWLRGLGKGRLARRKALCEESIVRAGFAVAAMLEEEGLLPGDVERLAAFLAPQVGVSFANGSPPDVPPPGPEGELGAAFMELGHPSLQRRASALARLADEAGSRLAERHRNHRQVLRGAIQDTLLAWLFTSHEAE